MSVCRYFYALGGAVEWENVVSTPPAEAASLALKRQLSWSWLGKRFLILHAGKVLAVTCIAAAMQLPSALGLLLVLLVSIAALLPLSSTALADSPGSGSNTRSSGWARGAQAATAAALQHAAAASVALLQLLVAVWLLMEYALQLPWFRQLLLDAGPPLLPQLLTWLGLPMLDLQPPPQPPGSGGTTGPVEGGLPQSGMGGSSRDMGPLLPRDEGYTMEVILRWKVLLIVAGSIWFRARR
jgi:hypothetical protein